MEFTEIKQISEYENYRISSKKPRKPIIPMLWIDNKIVCSKGNISIVSGAAKSRKTFFMSSVISALISGSWGGGLITGKCKRVAWFDTEQAEADAGVVFDRVSRMVCFDDTFDMFYLRGLETVKMIEIIDSYIKQNDSDFIVIDGIADLLMNPNDVEESTKIRNFLMNKSQELDIHFCLVLHVNYDSPKLRGHLGSELERKSEHVFLLTKDGDKTEVKSKLSRRLDYEPFNFEVIDGLPVNDTYIPKETHVETKLKPMKEVAPIYYESEFDRNFLPTTNETDIPF